MAKNFSTGEADPGRRIVVAPFHYHERVTGDERCFEQPWGMEQILAQVYLQMTALGLVPERRFVTVDDQRMVAVTDTQRAGRVVKRLERLFDGKNLPVLVYEQDPAVPLPGGLMDGDGEEQRLDGHDDE